MTPLPHPLARLRALTGDSQASYAELVSQTHETLGFGPLGSRREKVARWETQGIPPDHNTQLTIARIHQIPWEEVERLAWPDWLNLGVAAPPRSVRARTQHRRASTTSVEARLPTARPAPLSVIGKGLSLFLRQIQDGIAESIPPSPHGGSRVTHGTAALIESRSTSLHQLLSATNPVDLYHVTRNELRLVTELIARGTYDHNTGRRLLLVASQSATLCAVIAAALGESSHAERYRLTAARSAAGTGCLVRTCVCLADLALSHIDIGDPRDALAVIHAARAMLPAPPPDLHALLSAREARANSRLGEAIKSRRAMDDAATVLSNPLHDREPLLHRTIDEAWIAMNLAKVWLDMRQPRLALEQLAPILGNGFAVPTLTQPPLIVAKALLDAVDAQLALGDVESAILYATRSTEMFSRMPSGLCTQYRHRFLKHLNVPSVRELLDRWAIKEEYRTPDLPI
ncbi:hypothetical protein [Streptomyces sp. XH2]|uniref:hypothetical protein n=1 Tax=Streptomyces sp. XH2 TaxID=3412483 RepID=UPI003C7A44EB